MGGKLNSVVLNDSGGGPGNHAWKGSLERELSPDWVAMNGK